MPTPHLSSRPDLSRRRRALQLLIAAALLPATAVGPRLMQAHTAADDPFQALAAWIS